MDIFKEKIKDCESKVESLSAKLQRLSLIRLIVFIGSLVLIVYLANERVFIPLILATLICSTVFFLIVKRYNQVRYNERNTRFLKKINEEELQRLDNDFTSFPKGEAFIEHQHAFTADLDIFGNNSLFQLLNRTTTESGRILLANWLSDTVTIDEIKNRRDAAKELTPIFNWRQDFQAAGMHYATKDSDYLALKAWVEKPPILLPKKYKYYIISIILSLITCTAFFFYFRHLFTLGLNVKETLIASVILLPMLIINGFFINSFKKVAVEIVDSTQQNVAILKAYEALIIKIEKQEFTSLKLQKLKGIFIQNEYAASKVIKNLRRILSLSQLKSTKQSPFGNQFYPLLNILFILDVYWIIASEKWKAKYATYVSHWIDAISEFEVLNSMAGFHYANPSYSYPEISKTPYVIQFEGLGHPLIHAIELRRIRWEKIFK